MLRSSFLLLAGLGFQAVQAWHSSSVRLSSRRVPSPTRAAAASDEAAPTASSSSSAASYINPLIGQIQASATVELFSRVQELQASGVEVTSLCVGEPDFKPAKAVLQAVTDAVAAGATGYTAVAGTAVLRQAIAADLQRRKGLTYDAKTEIVVANGAKQCVYQGVLATAGVGDSVLIPAPYWPSYPEMAILARATPVIVPTEAATGYLLTADGLRAALEANPSTTLLILCNPSNPTGGVYSKAQLEGLADVLRDYPKVVVLADEIYERLVYVPEGVSSFAAVAPDLWDRTLTVNGFSKAYAMTGLRLGYLAAPAPLARAVTTVQSQVTSCAGSLSQAAGVAALTLVSDEELEANVEVFRSKRDYVLGELSTMPDVHVHVPPDGAFYVLPNVSAYYAGDDAQLCQDLLESEGLAIVPGSSFGAPGTVRLSYATSMEQLEVAMTKLRRFLATKAAAAAQ
jgi:aspartate/glutamate/aspartate-prephenate aminotransferase